MFFYPASGGGKDAILPETEIERAEAGSACGSFSQFGEDDDEPLVESPAKADSVDCNLAQRFCHRSPPDGLTPQAQRPGPQDAWIATTARWPGSLQHMVTLGGNHRPTVSPNLSSML
jgi:hypothetical protein